MWRTLVSAFLFVLGVILAAWGSQELLTMTEVPTCVYPVDELRADSTASASGRIQVQIDGAVNKPGIYAVASGDRLGNLINLAEGLAAGADRRYISQKLNLAQRLTDETKIYVPYRQEQEVEEMMDKYCLLQMENQQQMQTQHLQNTSEHSDTSQQVSQFESSTASCISINDASAAELQELPGVGEKRAADIIQNRPFSTIDDITNVAGIGEATLKNLKELICL